MARELSAPLTDLLYALAAEGADDVGDSTEGPSPGPLVPRDD